MVYLCQRYQRLTVFRSTSNFPHEITVTFAFFTNLHSKTLFKWEESLIKHSLIITELYSIYWDINLSEEYFKRKMIYVFFVAMTGIFANPG
jgi:hypothetical protein